MKSLFVPIAKVDQVQRLVYGYAAVEEPDKSKEIFDYETSKPLFEAWSAEAQKFSGGKSLGNVRAMHGKVAAGRLDQIAFNDEDRRIEVAAKVIDDNEWKKVEEGVYTGFSIGGRYEKRWADGEFTRYTASPSEVSLVDNPCQPSARFTMTKADGSSEERAFASVIKEDGMAVTNEQVAAKARELAKAAGDETKWASFIEKARGELVPQDTASSQGVPAQAEQPEAPAAPAEKSDAPATTPANPEEGLAQVWQAKDGRTFAKKAEAAAHNAELVKAEAEKPADQTLASTIAELTDAVSKAEQAREPQVEKYDGLANWEGGDDEKPYWLAKKDYSSDKRKEMADKGQAMKDGSFPIADRADLKNAVQAYGRAKDKVAAKKHIIARAKALDATDLLPADWEGSTKDAKKQAVAAFAKALGKGFRTGKAEDLQKGLYTVGCLARLIQELEYIHQETRWEATAEGDESTVPQELKEDIANLLNTLKNMLAEESSELFSDEEMDVYGEMLEAADRPKGLDALAKSMPDSKALAKVGARNSKKDKESIQKVHDHSVELGATCDKDNCGDMDGKSAAATLAKVTAERDDLQKQVQEALPVIRQLSDRVKKLEDTPMPRPGSDASGTLRVVNKNEEEAAAANDLLADLAKSNPGVIAEALIRRAQQRPMTMQPVR